MRLVTAPLLLAAAVGVPYAATNAPEVGKMWGDDSASETKLPSDFGELSQPVAGGYQLQPGAAYPARPASLGEVLRFDITKNWVFQRWQRKSTALAELDLFGVRVPLVTGTSLHDLAGSLTYYFDAQGQVQRISLLGSTGNTTQLEQMVTQHYGLQLQGSAFAGQRLYQLRGGENVYSELSIRPAAVLRSDMPHESFTVELHLQRPGSTRPLPVRQRMAEQSVPAVAQTESVKPTSSANEPQQESAEQETEESESSWDLYRPRSRVPEDQVDSLERRNRFW